MIIKTRDGKITESGGGMTNTGKSRIICGSEGQRLTPAYLPSRGYSNGDHAYFTPEIGMMVVDCWRSSQSEEIIISRVVEITTEEVLVDKMYGWNPIAGEDNIPGNFYKACDAAIEKATEYHCRRAYYCNEN